LFTVSLSTPDIAALLRKIGALLAALCAAAVAAITSAFKFTTLGLPPFFRALVIGCCVTALVVLLPPSAFILVISIFGSAVLVVLEEVEL